jgi:hypothetical protein
MTVSVRITATPQALIPAPRGDCAVLRRLPTAAACV